VAKVGDVAKRLILGRALSSQRLGEQLLSKKLALPIFSSDALSSVAYAPQEILLVLTLGGTAYLYLAPYLALAVALLMAIVVASYRQLVQAYPSGGGDYEVASKNLHPLAGVVVAAALLIDYVMTVAVSVSSGVDNLISAAPGLNNARVSMAVGIVVVLMAMNLRGVRESGTAFAIPTYAFIGGVLFMLGTGALKLIAGNHLQAESAHYSIKPEHTNLMGLAFLFFALRAFSSGCAALTGVEAIANGVPAFKPPKSKNAAQTLLLMGVLAITMFLGITLLGLASKVRIAEHTCDLIGFKGDCHTDAQLTIVAQVAGAVFGGTDNIFFYFIQGATALILVLAANTAFNGFPLLGSVLAQDRWLPRQLHTRGDRLVYSNGIIMLAAVASLMIVIYSASVTRLIQLYILGVFTSFTLGQTGMVVHWNRLLAAERDPKERRRMQRSRVINATGAAISGLVLFIVIITKFTKGAYLVLIAMPILFLMMRAIHRHYSRVALELEPEADDAETMLPSRNHAIVLVSKIHKPTLRALSYARATRPSTLEAVTVGVDKNESQALQQEWFTRGIPVELKVLDSPYREITKPILDYVKSIRRTSPRDVVTVFIPEYVVGHWWENLLHNQSALRLKGRLLFTPGVMVTSVPWQLESSEGRGDKDLPTSFRRPESR
jgi:amino acid transporter